MSDLLTVEQRNNRRLAKIHKLKRENRTLSSQRKVSAKMLKEVNNSYLSAVANVVVNGGNVDFVHNQRKMMLEMLIVKLSKLSEKIGKNSSKIQKLRTLINQSKVKI